MKKNYRSISCFEAVGENDAYVINCFIKCGYHTFDTFDYFFVNSQFWNAKFWIFFIQIIKLLEYSLEKNIWKNIPYRKGNMNAMIKENITKCRQGESSNLLEHDT